MTPNQVEAGQLTGIEIRDEASAVQAARHLRQRVETVIIKMGAQGALCATAAGEFWVSPYKVRAIDTVAAGDAFNGGLAAALAEGLPLPEACRWAAATGALATTVQGAQSAMPTRDQVLRLIG